MSKRDDETENDAKLWARIARTATPLQKNRVTQRPTPSNPPQAKSKAPAPMVEPPSSPRLPAKPAARQKLGPTAGPLDRQTARKLDKGRLAVEARLDLHGMRQHDAHIALRKFLKSAQGRGLRHVLVITGKGSPRDSSVSIYDHEPRGVLRQAVPHWLSDGDLAPLIVNFSEAPQRLGGGGALYVRLRKPDHARRKPTK
ncbi:MAG: Smr/MutS family protein [Hyphomicrobiaceae bacterium]|jgi:DNA-nicking Smr family endonuclease|nr:Smr/MutS family protein [Methyloceanibacter sp.]MDX2316882.1 Smr/MutS family protein [Hyphomicrobiaceae bacterium]MDX2448896.1 Smr/MutS family protein [Hyphomicrobiaceae bacterium]